MASTLTMKLQAAVLASALMLPAAGAYANDWSKPQSRTKGTIIGAVAGALVGGKKGAAIGGAAGGGAGTAVVLSTRGKEVHLPRGSRLTVRLSAPLTVRVAG